MLGSFDTADDAHAPIDDNNGDKAADVQISIANVNTTNDAHAPLDNGDAPDGVRAVDLTTDNVIPMFLIDLGGGDVPAAVAVNPHSPSLRTMHWL
jgi:hypothetical protein